MPGVKEDLVDVSLNLKKVKFVYDKDEPIHLALEKTGPGEVTAADIIDNEICQVANPDQYIATLADKNSKLKIDLTVEKGVGYTMAKEQKTDVVGEIILDALYSCFKVNYQVEPTRLGKKSNYDKLTMEIWTDGSVEPLYALKFAAKDLVKTLTQIVDPKEFAEEEVVTIASSPAAPGMDISIEEIELPLRVTNALKKAGYTTIESLLKAGRLEVSKAKNVGEKSLKIIDSWIKEKGFNWINWDIRQLATSLIEPPQAGFAPRSVKGIFYSVYSDDEAKAKAVTPLSEKVVARAKRDDLSSRRFLYRYFQDRNWVNRIVEAVAAAFSETAANFTQVKRIKRRQGDDALIVRLSFTKPLKLSKEEEKEEKPKKAVKKTTASRPKLLKSQVKAKRKEMKSKTTVKKV